MPAWRILVADDEAAVRRLVSATLGTGNYEVLEASDGVEALRLARLRRPHLALLDVNMPGIDGFQLLKLLKEDPSTSCIKTVMLTARASDKDLEEATTFGAEGYFTKPFSPVKLLDRISSLLRDQAVLEGDEAPAQSLSSDEDAFAEVLATGEPVARGRVAPGQMINGHINVPLFSPQLSRPESMQQRQLLLYAQDLGRAYRDLHSAYDATLVALMGALDVRDASTEGHSQRVVEGCLSMGKKLTLDAGALEGLRRGAILHDVGKIGVPDAILRKPGPLNEAEWEEMRKHPEYGARILSTIPFLSGALEIVLHHHESWNGTGYPARLVGTAIPLTARIFAIVDSWDAMTSDRPYRSAMSAKAARAEIRRNAGSQFDPTLVGTFLGLLA